ncbi:splicing factor ESS-2 homolog [Diadema antillarum]|uniref:splicing factor ESS-2 homolog n=1 Tax=Diadema antillarum TaxID=105358 RepID=UPI003A8C376B
MALVKAGEKALAVAASSELDVVTTKKKPPKRKVLDEEDFVSDLEKIIQRDFFPDLKKLKAQKEYMEAMEKNDLVKMRELAIKYASTDRTSRPGTSGITPLQERDQTPSTFETPIPGQFPGNTPRSTTADYKNEDRPLEEEEEDLTQPGEKSKSDTSLSLDKYLAKHTSEDNESFSEIMAKSAEKHRQKHAWLYEAEQNHEEQAASMLQLKSSEQLAIESRSNSVDGWRYQAKNALMYVPEGVDLSVAEKVMLKPKEREISHSNTRLTLDPFARPNTSETLTFARTTKGDGKVGPDGKETNPAEGPTVNGYGFVATPSPAPGVNDSPMMTWGEIEGTPFRLDGGDTPVSVVRGPQFKMPGVPRKERLGLSLVDKVTKKNRAKKEEALKRVTQNLVSPSPKRFGSVNSMERIRTLSSAAQKLVQRSVGHADKALRASYTPSPSRSMGSRTPSVGGTPNRTPGLTPGKSPATKRGQQLVGASPASTRSQSEPASLTDNLLDLPKRTSSGPSRKKATDYF